MTFGNAAPQINAKEGRVSASVVLYPYDDQKDIVLVNSRAKTALQVVSVEWVTNSPSSKIKLQVIKNMLLHYSEWLITTKVPKFYILSKGLQPILFGTSSWNIQSN